MPTALARHVLPSVQGRVADAVKAKREAGAGERRKALQAAQDAVGQLATNCELFAKGAASSACTQRGGGARQGAAERLLHRPTYWLSSTRRPCMRVSSQAPRSRAAGAR